MSATLALNDLKFLTFNSKKDHLDTLIRIHLIREYQFNDHVTSASSYLFYLGEDNIENTFFENKVLPRNL